MLSWPNHQAFLALLFCLWNRPWLYLLLAILQAVPKFFDIPLIQIWVYVPSPWIWVGCNCLHWLDHGRKMLCSPKWVIKDDVASALSAGTLGLELWAPWKKATLRQPCCQEAQATCSKYCDWQFESLTHPSLSPQLKQKSLHIILGPCHKVTTNLSTFTVEPWDIVKEREVIPIES